MDETQRAPYRRVSIDAMNLRLTVMMYHYVRDGNARGIPGLPIAEFEAQLDSLMRSYEMVSWITVCSALSGETSLPHDACCSHSTMA